jgi:hypothetical protein
MKNMGSGFRIQGSGFGFIAMKPRMMYAPYVKPRPLVAIIISFLCLLFNGSIIAADFEQPSFEAVKTKAMDWIKENKAGPAAEAKAEALWSKGNGQMQEQELLAKLTATFALVDDNAEILTALCSHPRAGVTLSDQAWLKDPNTPPFVAYNMRLLYATWLVQQSLFEEAREQLSGLEPSDVIAPARLLFYQSVVYQKLLDKESGLKTLEQLLNGSSNIPKRYAAVARLMQDDLNNIEEGSLGHIARRMDDVRRRLDLGRAGPKVREVEDGVIKSLDDLIKKVESQQQQQQQQSAGGGSTLRPANPAQDSMPMGGKGPGDVTKRDIGSESDWGNLPQKQRDEALQQIGRDFPSHYRDVIEQYFKILASEGSEN